MRFALANFFKKLFIKGKKTGLLEFSPPGIGPKVLRSRQSKLSQVSPTLTFLHGSTSNTYRRGTAHKYTFILLYALS